MGGDALIQQIGMNLYRALRAFNQLLGRLPGDWKKATATEEGCHRVDVLFDQLRARFTSAEDAWRSLSSRELREE